MTRPLAFEERSEAVAVENRRRLALEAAVSVLEAFGVVAERPVTLADSRDAELESLTRELAVAAHLSRLGAPIVVPAGASPRGRTAGATSP